MGTAENSAQTISFSWAVEPYPVKWVDEPSEVPPWDTSRDFPISAPPWEIEIREEANFRGVRLESSLLKVGSDASTVDKLRPLLCQSSGYSKIKEDWEPSPAPKNDYPRLVRANFTKRATPRFAHNEDVISEIAALGRFIESYREGREVQRLRKAIKPLAEKYGAPNGAQSNTLNDWLELIVCVDVYIRALRDFQKEGFEMMKGDLQYRHNEFKSKRIVDKEEIRRRLEDSREQKRASGSQSSDTTYPAIFHDLGATEHHEFRYIFLLLSRIRSARSVRMFRSEVADHLFEQHLANVTLTPKGIIIYAPLRAWVDFKLSELWRNGGELKSCPICNSVFVPSRSNQRYCKRGTCANKRYRQKREEK